jgi:hypothetical protein
VEEIQAKDDISEQNDIAAQHPEKVKQMRAKLHAWHKTMDTKFLQQKGDGPEPWRPYTDPGLSVFDKIIMDTRSEADGRRQRSGKIIWSGSI